MAGKGMDISRRPPRMVPVVLPLLYGPTFREGGSAADQAMESDTKAYWADPEELLCKR